MTTLLSLKLNVKADPRELWSATCAALIETMTLGGGGGGGIGFEGQEMRDFSVCRGYKCIFVTMFEKKIVGVLVRDASACMMI